MKMKNIITAAFISAVAFTSVSANVSAATKEDVLNAVREASPSETFVQAAVLKETRKTVLQNLLMRCSTRRASMFLQ